MKFELPTLCLVFVAGLAARTCAAWEFSDADVAPGIRTFILTEEVIAVEVDPGYSVPKWEAYPRYFAAKRANYDFKRISEDEFSRMESIERYERRFGTYPPFPEGQAELPSWHGVSPHLCSEYDYESGAKQSRDFVSGDLRVSVEMSCRTSVSRAISVEDEVWIATYRSGEFGEYYAEGVIVASLDGTELERIDVRAPIMDMVKDPWGNHVWALSPYGLTKIEVDHEISTVRWPVHQFDKTTERPDVVMPSDPSRTDPLAVVAYTLGENHYQEFARLIEGSTYSPHRELLYQYHMSDRASQWAEPAYLPDELDPILDSADQTPQLGHFSCFLRSDRAKTVCAEWLSGRDD